MFPGVVALTSADLESIAEAFGRDQTRARSLTFEYRVGGDRRTVHESGTGFEQRAGVEPLRRRSAVQRLDNSLAGIFGNRGHLVDVRLPRRSHEHEIGEGPTDIDADAPRT